MLSESGRKEGRRKGGKAGREGMRRRRGWEREKEGRWGKKQGGVWEGGRIPFLNRNFLCGSRLEVSEKTKEF